MRKALAVLFVAALASSAWANGRDPYMVSVHFKRGSEQNIIAGATFGLLISHDGGATWQWMCEKAIGYGGMWDPDYEYTSTDAIFATTFDGVKVMRNRCDFTNGALGTTFVSRVEQGPDGTIYISASDSTIGDSKIYKSTDDGMTFPSQVTPPGSMASDWWQSIEVAPSDAQRLYLTGYRLVMKCTANSGNAGAACTDNSMCTNGGMCEPQKEFLLYKSVDGGANYTTMTMPTITSSSNTTIDIVGIGPTSPTTLYIKTTYETGSSGDSIYRTTNSGATWTKILSKDSKFGLSFLARGDGTCVAGTRELGAWTSTDCATSATPTWNAITNAPHIGCLYENTAGDVWACTQMTASPQLNIDADGYGLMKSTGTLSTWTGVMKFPDIQAPVACAVGTVQNDQCIERYMDMQSPWCCLVPQIGITSTAIDCTGPRGCFNNTVDNPIDGTQVNPNPPGCCDAGSGSSAMLGSLVVVGLLSRRRKPRRR